MAHLIDDVGKRDLAGRAAVVTGASRGIGRAIALALANSGADVLLHTRARVDDAEQVAEQIRANGQRSDVAAFDLAESTNHERLAQTAWKWSDQIDIWVNNAGADVLTGSPSDWSFEQKLSHLWLVDVKGTIQLSRLAAEQMRRTRSKADNNAILNIGWDQAEFGMGGDSGEMFSAVKGAIMAFSRSLARSLAPDIRVNCIAPGWIQTDWGSDADPYWQKRAERESLVGRWGTPEDVAAMAKFLASPAASFITGQVLAVNGGFRGNFE